MFSEWPLVSGIEMSSSLGMKKNLAISPCTGSKKLASRGPKALGRKAFHPEG